MKLTDIKKELGGGTLLWIECFRGDKVEVVVHNRKDVEYDSRCMYAFETFVERNSTDSVVVKGICNRYGVDKVFAYQKHTVGTDDINKDEHTLLDTAFDCDCSYLIAVKKSVADEIPEDGKGYLIDCIGNLLEVD